MTSDATPGLGYVHHALFFESDDELVQVAVAFLQEGLAAGDAVVLACEARRNRLLADALGGDSRVGFLERSSTYLRIPVAVATYRRMVERELATGASRVRLVGEVDFGQDAATSSEWIRYEAVCNVALAPYPLWSVCAYDCSTLPEPILRAGHHTHPHLLTPRPDAAVTTATCSRPGSCADHLPPGPTRWRRPTRPWSPGS